ncbi:glycosyl transferase, partial [Streptomyces griseoincarnatus]
GPPGPLRYRAVPRVHRASAGRALSAATRAGLWARAGGPAPRTAAEAARHYSITRSSARLMDVYAAAVAGPSPSHHVKEAPSS